MTRRGSLVYYLAAWICGCFFTAVSLWVPLQTGGGLLAGAFQGIRGFLLIYFFSLPFGTVPALLFGLILRLLARALGWKHLVSWLVTGAAVAPLLAWGLIEAGKALGLLASGELTPGTPIFWLIIPVGTATAFILNLIHRAFEPRPIAAPADSAQM